MSKNQPINGKQIIADAKNKAKQTKEKQMKKSPKTIKVSTLIIGIAVLIGLSASFICGVTTANNFNSNVDTIAQTKAKQIVEASKPKQ